MLFQAYFRQHHHFDVEDEMKILIVHSNGQSENENSKANDLSVKKYIAQTYIDTGSKKLKQVKVVIIICNNSNPIATTTVVQSLFFNCRGINIHTCLHVNRLIDISQF